MKEYSYENFYVGTFANYVSCEPPERKPDFWSMSGSTYWYLEKGIIRWSNHWGEVNSCIWYLDNKVQYLDCNVYGFCSFDDFRSVKFKEEWLCKFYLEIGECGSVEDKSTGWLV